jgi:SM-20-related protein
VARGDLFAALGFLVVQDFLEADTCARIRAEVRSAASTAATVREGGARYMVDRHTRQASWAEVSATTQSLVQGRLLTLLPRAAEHFAVALTGCQTLQFLRYRQGDYYRPHRDCSAERDASQIARERQISVVIFVNGEAKEPGEDCYGGGALIFYGITDDPRGKKIGFPLNGEAGLLIAFRSDVVHEVAPVLHGERYTVVSWFH